MASDEESDYSYSSHDDSCIPTQPKKKCGGENHGSQGELPTPAQLLLSHLAGASAGGGGGMDDRGDYDGASSFSCATADTLSRRLANVVAGVVATTGLPEADAAQLLHALAWNSERLLELFFDDEAGMRARVGLPQRGAAPPARPEAWAAPGAMAWCGVLFEEVPAAGMDAGPCGHWFSAGAFRDHLVGLLETSPIDAPLARCMEAGCAALLPARVVEAHLPPPLRGKWLEWGVRRFARDSRNVVWCPGVGCSYAVVHRTRRPCVDVVCAAGHPFCFGCGAAEPHAPASCANYAAWREREAADGASSAWFVQHTKPCPKCKVAVERAGGCNKVVCSQCHTAMCFACGLEYYKEAGHS